MLNTLHAVHNPGATDHIAALPNAASLARFATELGGAYDIRLRLLLGAAGGDVLDFAATGDIVWLREPWIVGLLQHADFGGTSYDTPMWITIDPGNGRVQWYTMEDVNSNFWHMEGSFDAAHTVLQLEGLYPHAYIGVRAPCRVFYQWPGLDHCTYRFLMAENGSDYIQLVSLTAHRVSLIPRQNG